MPARPGSIAQLAQQTMKLHNLPKALAELGRWEEGLAASQESVTIGRELATRWPDIYRHELEKSSQIAAWLERERRAAGE